MYISTWSKVYGHHFWNLASGIWDTLEKLMLGDQVWLTVIVQVSSSQRCWMGLRSGLLTGQLYCSSDEKIISSWDLTLCTGILSCWSRKEKCHFFSLCEALEVINTTSAVWGLGLLTRCSFKTTQQQKPFLTCPVSSVVQPQPPPLCLCSCFPPLSVSRSVLEEM